MSIYKRGKSLVIGSFAGLLTGVFFAAFFSTGDTAWYPAPHTLALVPDEPSLRLAMVHDVFHERYGIHSEEYWRARLTVAKAKLDRAQELQAKTNSTPSMALLGLMDEYASCLDRLGRLNEATTILRGKLALQLKHFKEPEVLPRYYDQFKHELVLKLNEDPPELTEEARAYYRTYSGLGTYLVRGAFAAASLGDQATQGPLKESRGFLMKALLFNPQALYGADFWYFHLARHFLIALEEGVYCKKFDLCGNWLDNNYYENRYKSVTEFGGNLESVMEKIEKYQKSKAPSVLESGRRVEYRGYIRQLGNQATSTKVDIDYGYLRVVFDEPTLAMLSMWKNGIGEDPHLAVALANNMSYVGQDFIAWSGYERAKGLSSRFWKDEELHRHLIKFCEERQATIEKSLSISGEELRTQHIEEIAFGRAYQKAFQEYEKQRLKDGVLPDSEGFYDDFHKSHGPIATESGVEDKVLAKGPPTIQDRLPTFLLGFLFGMGLGVFVASFGD